MNNIFTLQIQLAGSRMIYNVSSGVTSVGITLLQDDLMNIHCSGVADNTIVNDGKVTVYSGGVANKTSVCSGGAIHISNGGTANSTTINDGNLFISNGGVVNSTAVNSDGNLIIRSGGVANSTAVNSKGNLHIHFGGVAKSIVVNSFGDLYINDDGVANSTSVNGGNLYINRSGTANTVSVNGGGAVYIDSCGVAKNVVVNGGDLYISSGGTASNVVWTPCVGRVEAAEGAYVTYASTYSGVYLGYADKLVSHADAMSGKLVSGSMYVMNRGTATRTAVNSGGTMYISSGGAADGTTVNAWGHMYIFSGGTAENTTVCSGGIVNFAAGCSANKLLLSAGGILGGFSFDEDKNLTNISNGSAILADNVHIFNSGMFVSAGGEVNGAAVNFNCCMTVSSGGTANLAAVNSGGRLYVYKGGRANRTAVNSGGRMYVYNGGAVNSTAMNYGELYVYNGGTVNSTSIRLGELYISSGGVVNCTVMSSGGSMFVSNGGVANSTTASDCRIYICRGGTATGTVLRGGRMNISSGGIAYNTVLSGNVSNNSSAVMYISSGGSHCGRLDIAAGAVVSAYSGGVIDFTVAGRSTSDGYLVNDLSKISGSADFTITVADDQAEGTYKLAKGASSFSGTLTIRKAGEPAANITVNGADLMYCGSCYSLDKVNGDLTLTVKNMKLENLSGNARGLYWDAVEGVDSCVVEYSTDNFANAAVIETSTNYLDSYGLPSGTYQWRVKISGGSVYANGNNFVASAAGSPQTYLSDADGNTDVFFARANSSWEYGYNAEHHGFLNGWKGTGEEVVLFGKNKISDVFSGSSSDANVLLLTDAAAGDALFLEDVYTALGDRSRLKQIDEIRAGAGNDIIDMTSQKFDYAGSGMKIYGGLGNDVIWAGNGPNILFGDAGADRIVGGGGNDFIIGGSGSDSMHGGGGDDDFIFGVNFGSDVVEQLAGGKVTLHFADGSAAGWNAETLTYSDGTNRVTVRGVTADDVTLCFGCSCGGVPEGAFLDAVSEKIFEDKNKGMLA